MNLKKKKSHISFFCEYIFLFCESMRKSLAKKKCKCQYLPNSNPAKLHLSMESRFLERKRCKNIFQNFHYMRNTCNGFKVWIATLQYVHYSSDSILLRQTCKNVNDIKMTAWKHVSARGNGILECFVASWM